MSSRVIKWFKRQASIRKHSDKSDTSAQCSEGNSEDKKKTNFPRLSFRKRHKKKGDGTSEPKGTFSLAGISKKFSLSVPKEMESQSAKDSEKNGVPSSSSTGPVSVSLTNSPNKTTDGAVSTSELSYHSSFDYSKDTSESFSLGANENPSPEKGKFKDKSQTSKDSDPCNQSTTFHSASSLINSEMKEGSSSEPTSHCDVLTNENMGNSAPIVKMEEICDNESDKEHPEDIRCNNLTDKSYSETVTENKGYSVINADDESCTKNNTQNKHRSTEDQSCSTSTIEEKNSITSSAEDKNCSGTVENKISIMSTTKDKVYNTCTTKDKTDITSEAGEQNTTPEAISPLPEEVKGDNSFPKELKEDNVKTNKGVDSLDEVLFIEETVINEDSEKNQKTVVTNSTDEHSTTGKNEQPPETSPEFNVFDEIERLVRDTAALMEEEQVDMEDITDVNSKEIGLINDKGSEVECFTKTMSNADLLNKESSLDVKTVSENEYVETVNPRENMEIADANANIVMVLANQNKEVVDYKENVDENEDTVNPKQCVDAESKSENVETVDVNENVAIGDSDKDIPTTYSNESVSTANHSLSAITLEKKDTTSEVNKKHHKSPESPKENDISHQSRNISHSTENDEESPKPVVEIEISETQQHESEYPEAEQLRMDKDQTCPVFTEHKPKEIEKPCKIEQTEPSLTNNLISAANNIEKKSSESYYPKELNPFGEDDENYETVIKNVEQNRKTSNYKSYPAQKENEIKHAKEDGSNPFEEDTQVNGTSSTPLSKPRPNGRFVTSIHPNLHNERALGAPSNPFGDSDEEDSSPYNREPVGNTHVKRRSLDTVPPCLPPKSTDLQNRLKNSRNALAPVPHPRKTKQSYHGSYTSLQNIPTYPIPAPRSVTPSGSTRTLNETTNPFGDDEHDDDASEEFERQGLGRCSLQVGSTPSVQEPFSRSELIRGSLPPGSKVKVGRKKRQAPLPPGFPQNKPPPSPCDPKSLASLSRKRSSTSPASEYGGKFDRKPPKGRSGSPYGGTPPPRPPPPKT